jgi:transposase-like protein
MSFRLSYRDLVEMMAERGVKVAHSTIRLDFLHRRDRGIAAAQAFFRMAPATNAPRLPRKVTLDGHVPSRRELWLLRREHSYWRNVSVRTNKYLDWSLKVEWAMAVA